MDKVTKHPGLKKEWADLPARRCDNCPVIFKPTRPEQRFHSPKCRFEAAYYGPGYVRLKLKIDKDLRALKRELRSDSNRELERLVDIVKKQAVRIRKLEALTAPVKRDLINPTVVEPKSEQM